MNITVPVADACSIHVRQRFVTTMSEFPFDKRKGNLREPDVVIEWETSKTQARNMFWRLANTPAITTQGSIREERIAADIEDFLEGVFGLVKVGRHDEASDLVYNKIDAILWEGDHRHCDELLRQCVAKVGQLDSSLMRLILSLTKRDKAYFNHRPAFFNRVYGILASTQDIYRANRLIGHLR